MGSQVLLCVHASIWLRFLTVIRLSQRLQIQSSHFYLMCQKKYASLLHLMKIPRGTEPQRMYVSVHADVCIHYCFHQFLSIKTQLVSSFKPFLWRFFLSSIHSWHISASQVVPVVYIHACTSVCDLQHHRDADREHGLSSALWVIYGS